MRCNSALEEMLGTGVSTGIRQARKERGKERKKGAKRQHKCSKQKPQPERRKVENR